jgi:antagonist of KipI
LIVVDRAPPYLTVQDAGRTGYRASGVPLSGAMDQWSLARANLFVGNPAGSAALEWAIGGGSLRFEDDTMIALTGADADATVDGTPAPMDAAISVNAGHALTIHRLAMRRFLYVAVRGGVDCPIVLGSRSTYIPAGLGGIGGRRLMRGDAIPIGNSGAIAGEGAIAPIRPAPDYNADVIRVIGATESRLLESFFAGTYTVSLASDRTGYRLEGETALDSAHASITSEPVCTGTIQLPPGGHPIVLMADSPTIGGYRILGTVISTDLPILAQSLPGRRLRFASVSVGAAQRLIRGGSPYGVNADM